MKKRITLCFALVVQLLYSVAHADDTEIFFASHERSSKILPNVLFVLDTSGSMRYPTGFGGTRIGAVRRAMKTFIEEAENVNIGIMKFNGSYGGGSVVFPVTDVSTEYCIEGACDVKHVSVEVAESEGDWHFESNALNTTSSQLVLGSSAAEFLGGSTAGVQFPEVNIPSGVRILSATLEFVAAEDTHEDATIRILGDQGAGNIAPMLATYSKNAETGSVDLLAEKYTDDPQFATTRFYEDWTTGAMVAGEPYQSRDITRVVQEIVNNEGWCGGLDMGFLLQSDKNVKFSSFDENTDRQPRLRVSYDFVDVDTSRSCYKDTFTARISSVSDVANQILKGRLKNRTYTGRGFTTFWGARVQSDTLLGVRFQGVAIPPNSDILDARIEFTNRVKSSAPNPEYEIRVENTASARVFARKSFNISKRELHADAVSWSPQAGMSAEELHQTPNIGNLVQTAISHPRWASGNAISFVINAKKFETHSFRNYIVRNSSKNPRLIITYRKYGIDPGESVYLTARDAMLKVLADIRPYGGTPTVDALFEASNYWTGDYVDYGLTRGGVERFYHHNYRVSHPDSYVDGTVDRSEYCLDSNLSDKRCATEKIVGDPRARYISPIQSSCQANHTILLTDGYASSNFAVDKVKARTGVTDCRDPGVGRECGVELVDWMQQTDHDKSLVGRQNVFTHTVGLNLDDEFLEQLAHYGGGNYYVARGSSDLLASFRDVMTGVFNVETSFVAPGATVNQFNRLSHRNDIYFALFSPNQKPRWNGNLKRYKTSISADGEVTILDADQKPAIDIESGYFSPDSRSYWSTSADGESVLFGGVSAQMEYGSAVRPVYTLVNGSGSAANIISTENLVHEDNTAITSSMLNSFNYITNNETEEELRTEVLRWARGKDELDEDRDGVVDEWRKTMGDPMHSRPRLLNYGTSVEDSTSVVYVTTNEGMLHAFDSATGKELYSFVPPELLPDLTRNYENDVTSQKFYGLDGKIGIWFEDSNNNNIVDGSEKAILIIGMRRGGNHYYAIDVSVRNSPRFLWKISGGTGGTEGFTELGQTWSEALSTKMRIDGQSRDVAIFGAGYDISQDPVYAGSDLSVRSDDKIGRGFFVVDILTGRKLWSVSHTDSSGADQRFDDMRYSVPSDVKLLDIDQDGYLDQLYFGDMGGQIWRFDTVPYHQSGDIFTGGRIASLAGDTADSNRRFYSPPDVALMKFDGETYMTLAIGSGWRAHPLDKNIEDRFYVLRQKDVYRAPAGYGKPGDGDTYVPIQEADLVDVTHRGNLPLTSDFGWMLDFQQDGEKVLSSSVSLNGQVIFTSYRPARSIGACSTAVGKGAVYTLRLDNGFASTDLDGSDNITAEDRSMELKHGGIPPEAIVLIVEKDGQTKATPFVGTENLNEFGFGAMTKRTYWSNISED